MKKTSVISIIVLFALCIATWSGCSPELYNNSTEPKIKFLNSYGTINYFPNRINTLTIGAVSKGNDAFEEVSSIGFEESYLSANSACLIKTMSNSDYALWSLSFDIIIDLADVPEEGVVLRSVFINGSRYELGEIKFKLIDEPKVDPLPLTLMSNTAASFGAGLSDYFASFENQTNSKIIVTDIAVDGYEDSKEMIQIGENFLSKSLPVEIEASALIEMSILLSECSVNGMYDVYYASPIITYFCNNTQYTLPLLCYISGMNISESEFVTLCDNYFSMNA